MKGNCIIKIEVSSDVFMENITAFSNKAGIIDALNSRFTLSNSSFHNNHLRDH